MLKSISRKIGSGGEKYDTTVGFEGMKDEQIQQDAMSFYCWKIQRTLRESSVAERAKFKLDGINLHASEVGKPVVSTQELVNKMSDEQLAQTIKLAEERLAKKE